MTSIPPDQPVIITGATASGKSKLAVKFASEYGGIILNADAMQVYKNWRILSDRPSKEIEKQIDHALYGHVNKGEKYSVGHWLKDIVKFLKGKGRPIVVGGTGLYLTALTEGLSNIPKIPEEISKEARERYEKEGLFQLLKEMDTTTLETIDVKNPMRVLRAWEVEKYTGTPLHKLHHTKKTTPFLEIEKTFAILVEVTKETTNLRIKERLDKMIKKGALEEVRENLENWNPEDLSSKVLGAKELIAVVKNQMSLEEAKQHIIVATRQYAKRQRTWFKKRMSAWHQLKNFKE